MTTRHMRIALILLIVLGSVLAVWSYLKGQQTWAAIRLGAVLVCFFGLWLLRKGEAK